MIQHYEADKINLLSAECALIELHIKAISPKLHEYRPDIVLVLAGIKAKNEDVVEVDDAKNIKVLVQCAFYECLEGC